MKTKFSVLICSIFLGISLSFYQINAQNIDKHSINKSIAGVCTPNISPRSYQSTLTPTRLDTLSSFITPGTWPGGLAWDGQYLWNCDNDDEAIYKLTITGDVISSFPLPDSAESGGDLVWDGNFLWLADEESAFLFKIDTSTGLALEHFHLPSFGHLSPNGFGLAWDGQYFWHCQYSDSAKIFKLDPQNGQVLHSFVPHKELILGIAWANGFLYGINIDFALSGGMIYKFETSSGIVLDSVFWEIPYPLGLVWDGQYFWNVSSKNSYGGNQRIYQVRNSITSIENDFLNKSNIINLMQNYPNPFNPTTTIKYALPDAAHVRMELFTITGKKIKVLVDENKHAGYHTLLFNAGDLSSGIYFYKITTNKGYAASKKFILLK